MELIFANSICKHRFLLVDFIPDFISELIHPALTHSFPFVVNLFHFHSNQTSSRYTDLSDHQHEFIGSIFSRFLAYKSHRSPNQTFASFLVSANISVESNADCFNYHDSLFLTWIYLVCFPTAVANNSNSSTPNLRKKPSYYTVLFSIFHDINFNFQSSLVEASIDIFFHLLEMRYESLFLWNSNSQINFKSLRSFEISKEDYIVILSIMIELIKLIVMLCKTFKANKRNLSSKLQLSIGRLCGEYFRTNLCI